MKNTQTLPAKKTYQKASPYARFLAYGVDLSLMYLLLLFYTFTNDNAFSMLPRVLWGYYFIGIIWLNLLLMLISTWKFGQTLGKKLFNIKVVTTEYTKLSLVQTLLREIVGKVLSQLLAYIGFLLPLKRSDRQAFHDILANTYVVKLDHKRNLITTADDPKSTKLDIFIYELLFTIAIALVVIPLLLKLVRFFEIHI